jgi:hypothetical protein
MIRDRGKIKWQGAFFMPEHVKMLREIRREDLKIAKPILDVYQVEEFEQKLLLAMEFTYKVKIKIWEEGFFFEYSGTTTRIDEFSKLIYLETEEKIIKIKFGDIVNIELMN